MSARTGADRSGGALMSLSVRQQLTYWGIATAVFLAALWWLADVILPFVLAGALAYVLDPLADRLERLGLGRAGATGVILLVGVLILILLVLLVIPTLVAQANQLVQIAPEMAQRFQASLTERFPGLVDVDSPIRRSLSSLGETIQSRGAELISTVLSSMSGIVNLALLLVIVPVVTVYLLIDWDRLVARVDSLLPRDHAPTLRMLARQVDQTLASFVRGQGLVCLILGVYYAVALWLVGLNFGLVVGAIAGVLTFIPYVGALVGGLLSIGLALFQFWGDWVWIVAVWGIFQSGQFIEGNFLTPKLVGDSVGLHPVWLLFALSAFGTLFGFAGLLVAVPVAATLGVLTRFAIDRYTDSSLYRGSDEGDEEAKKATRGEEG